ncbi:hypothetical protein C7N43_29295 [Sphingobacteriales bacterium UPWRP_1]|nr:hypothetical protein BVG80_18375 [Sphingobacteriales bacterium TSM_CSM]PSJ73398.1 hypothetical protein C7N43_29295 [Sphingobacteriales bacterium UPWRP_1]
MQPYLSIVVASRNDNHGGDMLKRMTIFVNGLIYQTRKHRLPTELLFVEWNPPQNAPLLHEVLPKPVNHPFLTIRYVVVPPQIHQTYRFAGVMPLYQMIAKNAGIRRAKANFILCTNVDLLFSDELFSILAQQNLQENCFYRANRCDIPATIQDSWSFEQQLQFAQSNIMNRVGLSNYYLHLTNAHPLLTKNKWIARQVNYLVGLKRKWFNNRQETALWTLDTDACGDFTLMSAKAWHDIQGYPELDLYSIHIDSMGLIAAAALGYQQIVFDETACTYHIDHTDGWASMNPIEKVHFWHKKPGIGWDIVSQCGQYLLQHKTTYNLNQPNWGFADTALEEIVL